MKQATRKELETMMIDGLAKIKDCEGVTSIGIYHVIEPGLPNWKPSFINFGDADEILCKRELPKIVKNLQAEYELNTETGTG